MEREPRPLARQRAAPRVRLGAAQARPTGAASSTSPRCASRRSIAGGRSLPAAGPAVVHDDVRPRQHLHEPAGAAVHAGARGDDAARARRLAGHARRRLPRRGPGPDPARDALRRDDRVRGAAALAVLRLRRRDAAVRRAARRVRALDRRHEARARARARGARGARTGSTSTPTCRATATSRTSAATRRPASRTSAGRTRGTRSRTATARLPGFPRATCELQGYAYDAKMRGARLARDDLEGRRRSPTSSSGRPPT